MSITNPSVVELTQKESMAGERNCYVRGKNCGAHARIHHHFSTQRLWHQLGLTLLALDAAEWGQRRDKRLGGMERELEAALGLRNAMCPLFAGPVLATLYGIIGRPCALLC